jgi:hypothetical protein
MEYFTEEATCWDAPPEVFKTACEAYRTHLAALLPHLRPEVRTLAETNLHDGLLRQIVWDRRTATVTLRLRCGCTQDSQGRPVGYFDLDVHYRRAVLTPAQVEALQEAAADRETEVLYDELDREPDGVFVHRLQCVAEGGYRELTIRFHELELVRTPREQRRGRRGWPRRRYVEHPG